METKLKSRRRAFMIAKRTNGNFPMHARQFDLSFIACTENRYHQVGDLNPAGHFKAGTCFRRIEWRHLYQRMIRNFWECRRGMFWFTFARNKEWLQGTLSWNRNQFFFLVSLYLHEVSENFISKSAVKCILTHPPLNSLFNRWKRTVSSCPITQQKPFALLRKNNKVFRKWFQEVSLNLRNNA